MAGDHVVQGDFGSRMRRAREQTCVSLRQIAETTKISMSALEALERNDVSRLPGGIFSRAIVRSYAAEIHIDPEQAVREFLAQFPHESMAGGGSPHGSTDDRSAPARWLHPRAMMLVVTIVMVAGALLLWSLR